MERIQEGPLARFMRPASLKNGAVIRSADAESLVWLENRIGGIVKSAGLRMVGLEKLQRRHRALVWVPPSKFAAAVLALLERQNADVGIQGWRVFIENVGASPEGRHFVFGIFQLAQISVSQ
ncbi:hypothetical protein P5V15_001272 [Pogonomyrmex californicus]